MTDPINDVVAVEEALELTTHCVAQTFRQIGECCASVDAAGAILACRTLDAQGRIIGRMCDALLSSAENRWIGQVIHNAQMLSDQAQPTENSDEPPPRVNRRMAQTLNAIAQDAGDTPEIVDVMRTTLRRAAHARFGEDWLDDEEKTTLGTLGGALRQTAHAVNERISQHA